jgi:hypothetical protein
MDFAHGTMVTVRSTTTTDDGLGNTTETVTESQWGPCAVAPRYATESTDPRVPAVIVGLTVMGPTRALDSDDTLVIGGVTYQVDGLPGVWESPFTGWAPGMEVPVKRASTV